MLYTVNLHVKETGTNITCSSVTSCGGIHMMRMDRKTLHSHFMTLDLCSCCLGDALDKHNGD